jgi:drug/metabolite transporter (DMT)-like permease
MRALPVIYLVLAAVSFGATFSLNKLAAEAGMPPLAYAFWQSALAGGLLLIIAGARGHRVRCSRPPSRSICWLARSALACRQRC